MDRKEGVPGGQAAHAFTRMHPRVREGLVVSGRRSVLKSGLAGLFGLSFPDLLRLRAGNDVPSQRSVILLWMTGGPSHIDTWDPKPDMPREIRGPFGVIPTRIPGVRLCEYLPKQARMLDRFTLIRSVDCRFSNHEPNMVMQTANLAAEPRTNPKARLYPAFGSVVAKHHGANQSGMPPYVVLNLKSRSHVAEGGYLGSPFDPFNGDQAHDAFRLPSGLSMERLDERRALSHQMDRVRAEIDQSGMMAAADSFSQRAYEIVAGGRAQEAFDLTREPATVVERYGPHDWARQALLARRLVERGSSFVTIDLSNHSNSGTWDTHGDNIPPYGGIWNGLRPLLPVFDHVITTLVSDLEERGLLQDTLVIAMGEFGRTPTLGTQGSTDGRNHWPVVMSMCLAGGAFRHGQVIGASTRDGGEIAERAVTPGDLAATIYHHMGVPLNGTYQDHQGRPVPLIERGQPLRELV
ncbi:MAG: DUF1501 domain-containing protein [Verrucomicrobia bacterium]|nr:DUF1501 domain-containing protein [Verrucomicrobiota bacterium]